MSILAETVFAANTSVQQGFTSLLGKVSNQIIYPIIGLAFAIAIAYFLWGVFEFIKNGDNPEERKKGQMHILWGIIGLAIMVAADKIVQVIQNTIGKL